MQKIMTSLLLIGVLLMSVVCNATTSHPRQSKTLRLEEAVFLAVRNNPEVRSAKLQRVIDKYTLEVARNEFLPQYVFDAHGEVVEGRAPNYWAEPRIKWKSSVGTELEVGVRGSYYDGDSTSGLTLSVRQPLLRGFGRNVTLASFRNALDNEQINRLVLKSQIESTITQVIKAYYKLVEDYNRLDVDKLALQDSLNALKNTRMKIKAGKLAPREVTQEEAQVADQRFSITQDKNTISQDYQSFLLILGLNPKSHFNIVRKIPKEKIIIPDMQRSIEIAQKQNIGFIKQMIGYEEKKRSVVVAKNHQLWKLDLVGSINKDLTDHYHLHSLQEPDVYEEKRLALELDVPIHDVRRKAELVDAQINLKKFDIALDNAKHKLEAAVVNGVRDLQAQKHQIESAERSVKLTQESLYVARRKLEFGRATMFEVTSLRKTLTQRENELIRQRIAYLNTMAQFEQTLGETLRKWRLTFYGEARVK